MERIEKSVEVKAPVNAVYNQWTQFEEFPSFMKHVEEVRQIDDAHLHWRANVCRQGQEWDAEIVEQIPDRRVAWRSTSGDAPNAGEVRFEPVGADRTRVHLAMEYEPARRRRESRRQAWRHDRAGAKLGQRFQEIHREPRRRPEAGAARSTAVKGPAEAQPRGRVARAAPRWDRKTETPRPGAARVEVEHAAALRGRACASGRRSRRRAPAAGRCPAGRGRG